MTKAEGGDVQDIAAGSAAAADGEKNGSKAMTARDVIIAVAIVPTQLVQVRPTWSDSATLHSPFSFDDESNVPY